MPRVPKQRLQQITTEQWLAMLDMYGVDYWDDPLVAPRGQAWLCLLPPITDELLYRQLCVLTGTASIIAKDKGNVYGTAWLVRQAPLALPIWIPTIMRLGEFEGQLHQTQLAPNGAPYIAHNPQGPI